VKAKRFDERVGELEALYRTQSVRLRKILRAKFVGSIRPNGNELKSTIGVHDVDDLIQEVFTRVLASGGSTLLDKVREPTAYLVTIARNLAIDSVRRHHHHASMDPSIQTSDCTQLERAPFDDLEFYERCLEAVAAYVAGLPAELSAAFEARFRCGMSQRDAAIALGVTRRRVRTLEGRLVAGAAEELELGAARAHGSQWGPVAANQQRKGTAMSRDFQAERAAQRARAAIAKLAASASRR
jgi:RNA polymerase sigma-70 factor (ECF subfamily)